VSEETTAVASDGGATLRRGTTVVLVALLLVSALATLPVAFVHLDTLDAPAVTTESEFAAVTFTAQHATESWTTDHSLSRIGVHSYPDGANTSYQPVAAWLQGGAPPGCPTLAQDTWASSGAHLFPAPAERISPAAYEGWQAQNNVVYSTRGLDATVLVRPRTGTNTNASGC
jgi:hypothetical protein